MENLGIGFWIERIVSRSTEASIKKKKTLQTHANRRARLLGDISIQWNSFSL